MEKRKFGRTGHYSTVAVFGAAAFWEVTRQEAESTMQAVINAGINHIDVAPSYGSAEVRLGPIIESERERFFLGCKTFEREKESAWRELNQSLTNLRTDKFDLYQMHAVATMQDLEDVTRKNGSLAAALRAREEGLTQFIGITSHGLQAPSVLLSALSRFGFDTVLFPVNFILFSNQGYRESTLELLKVCRQKDVGVMAIKSIAKAPWEDRQKSFTTWYEPFSTESTIQEAINFTLSQDITAICTAGDINVLPMVISACEQFSRVSDPDQEKLIASSVTYKQIFS